MKATWTISEHAHRFLLLMAVILTFACTGCSENLPGSLVDEEIYYDKESVSTEFFVVSPNGSTIHAFGGDVILDFLPGTIPTKTHYSIVSFPLEHLDLRGHNLMLRAISLTNITNGNAFKYPVKVIMRYDLCEFNVCEPGNESQISIYRLRGNMHAFHKIEAMGECCTDCTCKTVSGCIEECGSFVLVEK